MEYAFALIIGYTDDIIIRVVKDLIQNGFENDLKSLICIYDLNNNDIEKIYNHTKNDKLCLDLKKSVDKKFIMPIFTKGVDACSKIKSITSKYENSDSYIYVSKQAISDLCYYYDVSNFKEIENLLFKDEDPITTFPFKDLSNCKIKKH